MGGFLSFFRRMFVCFFFLFFALQAYAWEFEPLGQEGNENNEKGLRYNEVQFGVAPGAFLEGSDLEASWKGDCLGVEWNLSKVGAEEDWDFAIQSEGKHRADASSLRSTLRKVRVWSDAHPGHHIITVYLNLLEESVSGDDKAFCDKLDRILLEELSVERLFVPAFLQKDASSLLSAVCQYGWPYLEELRGNFIIVLSGNDDNRLIARRKMVYTFSEPHKRLAFVAMDRRLSDRLSGDFEDISNLSFKEGSRVFLNLGFSSKSWMRFLQDAHDRGFVTNLWKIDTQRKWDMAKSSSANFVVVDDIFSRRRENVSNEVQEEGVVADSIAE